MQVIQLTIGSPEYSEVIRAAAEEASRATMSIKKSIDWISEEYAKELLGNASTSQMEIYRKNSTIAYTQPSRKLIMYSLSSIVKYLDKHKVNAR